VSDGYAANGSNAATIEMANVIKQIFPQAQKFAAVNRMQAMFFLGSFFKLEVNVFVGQTDFKSLKGGRCRPDVFINVCI
jgi:S-adenosylmethionine hydrolase